MSDFLHNLRTGNLKRTDRPRRNYDNSQHRNQNDRNYGKDRKGNYHKKAHTGDQLQEIKKHLESIAKTVESNFKAQEKAAAALERIATVLESASGIEAADAAVRDESSALTAAEPQTTPEPAKDPETATLAEDVLLATIAEMRNDGVSFEKIAVELEKREIPTISGRGKWRGPAVSKLLKDTA